METDREIRATTAHKKNGELGAGTKVLCIISNFEFNRKICAF